MTRICLRSLERRIGLNENIYIRGVFIGLIETSEFATSQRSPTSELLRPGIKSKRPGDSPSVVLFYAVRNADLPGLRRLVDLGVELDCSWKILDENNEPTAYDGMPLLAFKILAVDISGFDPQRLLVFLFEKGISASKIPKELWRRLGEVRWISTDPEEEDLSVPIPNTIISGVNAGEGSTDGSGWLKMLSAALDNQCRYSIQKGESLQSQIMPRERQHLRELGLTGHAGHGKTELARGLARAVRFPSCIVDCSTVQSKHGLFDLDASNRSSGKGLNLNKFLIQHQGSPAMVLLDKFEKANREAYGCLPLWERGYYRDRREFASKRVDVKDTIWIVESRECEQPIRRFSTSNLVEG
ncbi:MAG: hypothetical protein M1828_000381 [Chrysothrix sp. TS-e1954]|nr:MAG: hypothetical protein M1828_000381 [Chrysothrix sp. TS-e1954]